MEIPIINMEQLIEGLTASIFFPLAILVFKYFDKKSFYIYTMLAWFTTWFFRKFFVNIYLLYLKNNNLQNTTLHLYI